jgi:hypothetical protein
MDKREPGPGSIGAETTVSDGAGVTPTRSADVWPAAGVSPSAPAAGSTRESYSACLGAAIEALGAGISVWPPRQDGTKAPDFGSWKSAQSFRADESVIREWYRGGRTGVGWVTGAVSGNLEVLDFDDRSTWVEYQRLCREAGVSHILERVVSGYLEHTPNGAHLVYRCSEIEGNQKLAQSREMKSLIETRGEGGFIIVAPSHGSVNLKGAYTIASGGVASIATITPDERRHLFDVARIFDEAPRAAEPQAVRVSVAGRPGDDFNARASWEEVLEPHGWQRVGGRLGVASWRRPGKEHGISATTNHAGSDLLYVFSTSTGFDANRGYSKFSAYAILEHGGDFGAAAHALSLRGYGVEVPEPDVDVDISGILSGRSGPPALDGLMRVPGLVGELADWIEAGAVRSQPVLALAASIAAMAALAGRKARTSSGMRPNIYVLGVGETGCGKERARKAIGDLFTEIGADKMLGDSFASDAAIEAAMEREPSRLFLVDEIGYLLGTLRDDLAPSHIKSIVPVLLRMYSSSAGVYRKRVYAQSEGDASILQPSLSIYGTTVPSNFYANITKAHLSNGLLGRLLVFESKDPYPEMRLRPEPKAPASLVAGCKAWVEHGINADPDAGDIERRTIPNPLAVNETADALSAYDDLEATMRRRVEEERKAGRDQGPFTRVTATAIKLALIRACGVSPGAPEITSADAEWGCALAWRLTEDFMVRVGDAAPENKTEAAHQKVRSIIDRSTRISRRDLVRRTQSLQANQLDAVLKTLLEAGYISVEEEPSSGGRKKTIYTSVNDGSVLSSTQKNTTKLKCINGF